MVASKAWKLVKRPVGDLSPDDLKLVDEQAPDAAALPDGHLLVRVVYLSVDPTNRIWMSDREQYMPPVELNESMRGLIWGVVEESKAESFAKGDLVSGLGRWEEYCLTAYYGMLTIGEPKEGETVVVSTAAGAVGSIAGQLAKLKGCRVVGLTSTDEKCKFVKEELGFDEVINYKKEKSLEEALRRACPKGIDVYFENVGGVTFEAVLKNINLHARVPLCGLISTYNSEEAATGPRNFEQMLMKRVKLQGFIILDFWSGPQAAKAMEELGQWVKEGKVKYRVQLEEGLENAPTALGKLFTGGNIGKLAVKVSEPPKPHA
eukprot:jgi/Chlat1/2116/Chrsp17S02710